METNNTGSIGKYLSSNSSANCTTNGDLHTEDFLMEFFPELKDPEVHSFSKDKKEMQQEENMMNGHRSLIDDLFTQNEKLKLMNKELKEKSILQESQIAKYEVDLSEKMQHVLTANQELEEVKEECEKLRKNNEEMDKDLTQVKAQVKQLLDINEKTDQANTQILDLQKDVSSKEKVQRRLKNELETLSQKLTEKNCHVKKMKSANKKLWNFVMEMSENLSKNGLLTVKRKEQFLKEIDDQISTSELCPDGENIKAFLFRLSTASGTSSAGSAAHSGNNRTPKNSSEPGSSIERQPSRSSALLNASAENCVTSNIKTYSSNYFMKNKKEVIEDLVSEDYKELNSFRQQLSVRNEPISPLPPTPPPKNAKLKADNSQSEKSSVFAGKKLNFFHQQSESFEVQNVETINKPPESNSARATPIPNQYTISSKLNPDGSLKLDFSANYDTHLSFDMNTRKVSCTVIPSPQISTDCSNMRNSLSSLHPGFSEYNTPRIAEKPPNHSSLGPVKSNLSESVISQNISTYSAGIKKTNSNPPGANFVNDESVKNPRKIKLDSDSFPKRIQNPIHNTYFSSPTLEEKGTQQLQQNNLNMSPEGKVPNTSSLHEKKTLNDIGRSGKIYSAFVSPAEKRVPIPSVRVSPRQLKAISSHLECQMEIDNLQQPSVDPISMIDDKSPKKRKKRSKKHSDDLLSSSASKSKSRKKSHKITKKRKILDFEGDEKNENHNEELSPNLQGSEAHAFSSSPKDDSPSRLKRDTKLQNDSLSSGVSEKSDVSPTQTSDPLELPRVMNEDDESIKGLNSNVTVEDLPKNAEPREIASAQSDDKLNNDMDFSDIQVSPFNPSTFVPRGLFVNELSNLDSPQKLDPHDSSVLPRVDSPCAEEEVAPSSLENTFKESTNFHFNPTVNLVSNGNAEMNPSSTNTEEVLDTLSNGHLLTNDGLDSDHSLVIAESSEDVEHNGAMSDSAETTSSPSKKEGARKKKSKMQSKNKKSQAKKSCVQKEGPKVIDVLTIDAAFRSLEEMKYNDLHFKQNQHTLVNALINPNNAPESKDAVYQVLKYLVSSKAKPLLSYSASGDESHLMPPTEKCIVQALFQITKKNKLHLQELLLSVVNTAYEVILTKESLPIYGLSSLCRVLTEICKFLENRQRPLMLCSELLKYQHKYAPYLIASVAGVWKELFSVADVSEEELMFHSSIVYGMQKKPSTLNEEQWKLSTKVLSLCLTAPFPYNINEMVNVLVQTIETECVKGCLENEYILTTPLVVFTAHEGWNWAKEMLINPHLIPLLVKFSEQEVNEKAFSVFCQLYADICYYCPDDEDPHEVFWEFFHRDLTDGNEFVKDVAALAQIKLLLYKKEYLPDHLTEWVRQIQQIPYYFECAERLFNRRLMVSEKEFVVSEVQ